MSQWLSASFKLRAPDRSLPAKHSASDPGCYEVGLMVRLAENPELLALQLIPADQFLCISRREEHFDAWLELTRRGLEATACECYATIHQLVHRLDDERHAYASLLACGSLRNWCRVRLRRRRPCRDCE
jgi:hypothetical protein